MYLPSSARLSAALLFMTRCRWPVQTASEAILKFYCFSYYVNAVTSFVLPVCLKASYLYNAGQKPQNRKGAIVFMARKGFLGERQFCIIKDSKYCIALSFLHAILWMIAQPRLWIFTRLGATFIWPHASINVLSVLPGKKWYLMYRRPTLITGVCFIDCALVLQLSIYVCFFFFSIETILNFDSDQ